MKNQLPIGNNMRKLLFLMLMNYLSISWGAVYWVGDKASCIGSGVYSNFESALWEAALNGDKEDTIHITKGLVYDKSYTLLDPSGAAPKLTIMGGYDDCFGESSGYTTLGGGLGSVLMVNAHDGNGAEVILKNVEITGAGQYGVVARGGVSLILDNVDINNNDLSGLQVLYGASVEVLQNSSIRLNRNLDNLQGGGIFCTGLDFVTNEGSLLEIRGSIDGNLAENGSNVFVGKDCEVVLHDGALIIGGGIHSEGQPTSGGGIFVDNGGVLHSFGKNEQVLISHNVATSGGGLMVNGTGRAVLYNTHFDSNEGSIGAAMVAIGGGDFSPQVVIDRNDDCDLLYGCSEITDSQYRQSVIVVDDSILELNRTVIKGSNQTSVATFGGLVQTFSDGLMRLNRVGIIQNEALNVMYQSEGVIEATHITVAGNTGVLGSSEPYSLADATHLSGNSFFHIENSIITDTQGTDVEYPGSVTGKCNLVDVANNTFIGINGFPSDSYHLGEPNLIDVSSGDARQHAHSDGVDMCLEDGFLWSNDLDIENQLAPVDVISNPAGIPGEAGGLYDAGFSELGDIIFRNDFE